MSISLRRRLLVVAALAAIACGGAFFVILRLVRTSTEQRIERAREAVTLEVDHLREAREAGLAPRPHPRRERVVQGGYLGADFPVEAIVRGGSAGAPPPSPGQAGRASPAQPRLAALADAIRAIHDSEEVVVREAEVPGGTLVVGVGALPRGGYAWAAQRVPAPREMQAWRWAVLVLVGACLLLVLASLQAFVAYQRDAQSLRRSLVALGSDLGAPLARPRVRELGEVADGIATLARDLQKAQGEQARLQRELAERERLAALGRVAAGMAHEVRNPLAAIKLRADLARKEPGTPPQLAQDLADISAETARLDRLMNDLLTVAARERRGGPWVQTDLLALAQQRVALLTPWAQERGVALVIDAADAACPAEVAPDAIARALDNLLRNAVEAAPAGSAVRVAVGAADESITLAVTDQGPGVPAERAEQLFEPFFTTKPEGTGLGLALSRAIAAAHGGALRYEREGTTTRFVLTLPLRAPAA